MNKKDLEIIRGMAITILNSISDNENLEGRGKELSLEDKVVISYYKSVLNFLNSRGLLKPEALSEQLLKEIVT
jgi:hypothetical protein